MTRLTFLAAAIFGLAVTPAQADDAKLYHAALTQAAPTARLDVVAETRMTSGNVMEVTASFTEDARRPKQIVMELRDGDRVAFAMPGRPELLYHFVRRGDRLATSVEKIEFVEVAQIE
jgi:hypothetical protein